MSLWIGDFYILQNWWQRSDSEVWWPDSDVWCRASQTVKALFTDVFVQGRWWMSSGEAALDSQRRLMKNFGTKFP